MFILQYFTLATSSELRKRKKARNKRNKFGENSFWREWKNQMVRGWKKRGKKVKTKPTKQHSAVWVNSVVGVKIVFSFVVISIIFAKLISSVFRLTRINYIFFCTNHSKFFTRREFGRSPSSNKHKHAYATMARYDEIDGIVREQREKEEEVMRRFLRLKKST